MTDLVTTARDKFEIPYYQRDYSWGESQFDDLWRDLHTVLETNKVHFFGTILVSPQHDEPYTYDVIDGQQRLTTLLILINEIAKGMNEEGHDRANWIRDRYIAPSEGYKLTLKGEDERFFRDRILGGENWSENTGIHPDTQSKRNLVSAKEYFQEKLEEKRESTLEDFEEFSDYLDRLITTVDALEVMVYEVKSEAESVRIFEATNDRGKDLTDLERTKSFLMYHLHLSITGETSPELRNHLDVVRDEFKNMYKFVDRDSSDRGGSVDEEDIQRYHFIVWDQKDIRQQNPPYQKYLHHVKERFRRMPNGEEKVESIMDYTEQLGNSFNSMHQIRTKGVIESSEIENQLRKLFALRRVANFYPLLVASWKKYRAGVYQSSELAELIRRLETYVFRVYVLLPDTTTRKARNDFYVMARDIHQHDLDVSEAINQVESLIHRDSDDEKLRRNLDAVKRDFYNEYGNLLIRYLLYFYDVHLSGRDDHLHLRFEETVNRDYDEFDIWIEHIWPDDSGKLGMSEEEIDMVHNPNKHRLGNLALMTGGENASQGNHPFEQKREAYRTSSIRMLNEVAELDERPTWGNEEWDSTIWGVERIEAREEAIIDFILKRWPDYQATGSS